MARYGTSSSVIGSHYGGASAIATPLGFSAHDPSTIHVLDAVADAGAQLVPFQERVIFDAALLVGRLSCTDELRAQHEALAEAAAAAGLPYTPSPTLRGILGL